MARIWEDGCPVCGGKGFIKVTDQENTPNYIMDDEEEDYDVNDVVDVFGNEVEYDMGYAEVTYISEKTGKTHKVVARVVAKFTVDDD